MWHRETAVNGDGTALLPPRQGKEVAQEEEEEEEEEALSRRPGVRRPPSG